jgi:hypothetical protein
MNYRYEITPRPMHLGSGFNLRCFEDDLEVMGGAFPIVAEDPNEGMPWWNALEERERVHWLAMAGSAHPANARAAFRLAEAQSEAEHQAQDWLNSRPASQ